MLQRSGTFQDGIRTKLFIDPWGLIIYIWPFSSPVHTAVDNTGFGTGTMLPLLHIL